MANLKAGLLWHCKTENGWKRFPVLFSKNGRIKTGVVLIDGKEQNYPDGAFHLRTYEGRNVKFRSVGKDAAEAVNALARETKLLKTRDEATQLGGKVVLPDDVQTEKLLTKLRDELIADKELRKTKSCASLYRLTLDGFFVTCKKLFASEIVAEDALRYADYLRKEGFASYTVCTRYNALIGFLKYAGVADATLPSKDDRPKKPKDEVEVYEDDEQLDLLFKSSSPRNALLFEVLLKTGLREQEAATLEWWNLDLKSGIVKIRNKPEINFKIKDDEERNVPIPRSLVAKLSAWKEANAGRRFVFGTPKDKVDGHLLRALKREARDAGLNCDLCEKCERVGECEHWWLHKFRATFATTCFRGGMDARTLMRLLGHSDIETTMKYLSPARDESVKSRIESIWGEHENVVTITKKRKKAS